MRDSYRSRGRILLLLSFAIALIQSSLAQPLPPSPAFRPALPGYIFAFPRDHGSHPDFRSEWWYFTGNLADPSGHPFGFELTAFRFATIPPGDPLAASPLIADQVYSAHFAISDIDGKRHESWERIGRTGLGQSRATTETLDVALGDWSIRLQDDNSIMLSARSPDGTNSLRLTLNPQKPLVIHGKDGVHQKAGKPGQASHYISFTRLAATGEIQWQGAKHSVSGLAWMDHEFGSDQLADDETGWDWFALQLDSGEDLMLYRLRRADGTFNPAGSGSLIDADGGLTPVKFEEYVIEATGRWKSPGSGADYPMGWKISLPGYGSELAVAPAFNEQEMLTKRSTGTDYWEGAVRVSGTWRGQPAAGKGYVELVGYAGRMRALQAP